MSDPNWADQLTAWTTLGYAILTLVLAIAASVAASLAKKQLDEARKSREGALRPVVVTTSATRSSQTMTLHFKNIGPGPALGLRVTAWLLALEKEPEFAHELEQVHQKAAQIINNGESPSCLLRLGSLGAGDERSIPTHDLPFAKGPDAPPMYAVATLVEFEDVFANRFPKPGSFAGETLAIRDVTPHAFVT